MSPIALAFGPADIGVVALVVVVLFGVKRLPELGRSLAEGIREFKKASTKTDEEDEPKTPE